MDFIRDMELISKAVLDQHGMDYSAVAGWEIVRMFLNFQSKLIEQIPRNVLTSKNIQNSSYSEDTKKALAAIEHKFSVGEDVNPHLSKGLLNGTYMDQLFADWGIYHLHLNTNIDGNDNRFVKRSKYVLFVTLSGGTVYFVDIRPHGLKGEPHVFAQKSLLQTIVEEWPWILEPYKIKDAISIKDEINDAKGIRKMRNGAVNLFHNINGGIYVPPGGGITPAGTSMVTRRANDLYYLAKDAEKYVTENRVHIDNLLSRIENYNSSEARFRLGVLNDNFLIYEERTRTVIVYLGG
jgi:hypothetical protein